MSNKERLQLHHEVRNSLNVIFGFVQVLRSGEILTTDEQHIYCDIIDKEVNELLIYLEKIMIN